MTYPDYEVLSTYNKTIPTRERHMRGFTRGIVALGGGLPQVEKNNYSQRHMPIADGTPSDLPRFDANFHSRYSLEIDAAARSIFPFDLVKHPPEAPEAVCRSLSFTAEGYSRLPREVVRICAFFPYLGESSNHVLGPFKLK